MIRCARVCIVCLFASVTIAGCNIVTPAYMVLAPEPKIDAMYELPDRTTVVLVDDQQNLLHYASNKRRIAEVVSQSLLNEKVVSDMLAPQTVLALTRDDTYNDKMSLLEIGRAVEADQIIYVVVTGFMLDRFDAKPKASCNVEVYDVAAQQRVYPEPDSDERYVPVQVSLNEVDLMQYTTPSETRKLMVAMSDKLGERVSRLFYRYNPRPLGGNLNPR